MADSFQFTAEIKQLDRVAPRNPLKEIPQYKISDVSPSVYEALDIRDHYDVSYGDDWVMGLNPQQTLIVLKKARSMYMAEINKVQKEIDRITLLEMDYQDPRANTPWPRYYELKVKKEKRNG